MRLPIPLQQYPSGPSPAVPYFSCRQAAAQAAGVPGLLFHDLRRTAVRNLRRAGVAESVIMKITGHETRGVFERYNITDQSDTLEAGKLAEEFLNQAHSEKSSQNSAAVPKV